MHKVAFEFGGFTIAWYGILVTAGFLAGLWTASRRALLDRIDPEKIWDLGPWLMIGTIVGARLLYVVSYWHEDFAGKPFSALFNLRDGGLVFYGGFIGASLGCILYARRKHIQLWRLADILAPGIALGSFFGRWGCLMTGCCYGRPTRLPWGIHFPEGHPSCPDAVHPTQIYDSLLNLGLYCFLAWLFRRKKFDGQVFVAFIVCYAFTRSFVEFFRGDYTPVHYFGGLTPGQFVSAGMIILGAILFWKLPRRRGAEADVARASAASC